MPTELHADIFDALSLLTPVGVSGIKLVRIGHPIQDGGYVMADRFRPGQKVYSYGISTEHSFDLSLARRGLEIFMYDHTIDPPKGLHPNCHYFREGISAEDRPSENLMSLATHVAQNGHESEKDMIFKMDVEGAEWEVLDKLDPSLLRRFEQITLEWHYLERLEQGDSRATFKAILTKLRQDFDLIHVHANSVIKLHMLFGSIPSARYIELSFLRKGIAKPEPWRKVIPTQLDRPNRFTNAVTQDHVLSFYPFLPQGLSGSKLRTAIDAAVTRACRSRADIINEACAVLQFSNRNVASEGHCTMSSVASYSKGNSVPAQEVVKSEKTGIFAIHTEVEDEPWWQIAFSAPRPVTEIAIYNRLDKCTGRNWNLVVETAAGPDDDWTVIHENTEIFGGADGLPLRVTCDPAQPIERIRLRIPERTALHLDAVEVYAI